MHVLIILHTLFTLLVSGFSTLSIGLGCGCSCRLIVQNVNKQIALSTDVFCHSFYRT